MSHFHSKIGQAETLLKFLISQNL